MYIGIIIISSSSSSSGSSSSSSSIGLCCFKVCVFRIAQIQLCVKIAEWYYARIASSK